MEKTKLDLLREQFPQFYENIRFDCGPGWYDILFELSTKIQDHIKSHPDHDHSDPNFPFTVFQIKEKYGTLRYYVLTACLEIFDLIEQAELKSETTCEACGAPGQLHNLGWYYTRCDECMEKMNNDN